MDEQRKIGIGIGTVGTLGIVSVLGYWVYKKAKEQAEIKADIAENYQNNDKPFLEKLKDKLFSKDYEILPKTRRDIEKDLEEYEKQHKLRNRFTVYGSTYAPINSVQERFKVMETLGDKGVEVRGTGRFRASGNIHRKTEGGYSRNRRNANFSDLIIP